MSVCVCPDWKPVSVPGLKCKLCQRLRHGEVTREAGTHGQQTLVVATRTHNGKAQPLIALRQTAYCTLRQAYPPPCRPTAGYSSLHRRPFTGPQPITVPSTDGRLPAHSRLQFPPQTAVYRPTADYSSLHRRPFTGPQTAVFQPTADYSSPHRPQFSSPQPITVPSTDRSFPAHSRLQFPPQTVLYRPTADYSSLHRPSFTGPQPITVPSTDRRLPAQIRLQFPPQTAAYRPTADYSSLHRPPLTGPSAWLQHKALPEAGNPAVWKRNP